tara:strand:- start:16 stop:291 length:276 start_codon:yes stop_codon:yes gene_type:complete
MNKPLKTSRVPNKSDLLSLVVPVFNERSMLPIFFEHVLPILASLDIRSEIVVVDDGSEDGSAEFVKTVIEKRSSIRLVKLSRTLITRCQTT